MGLKMDKAYAEAKKEMADRLHASVLAKFEEAYGDRGTAVFERLFGPADGGDGRVRSPETAR